MKQIFATFEYTTLLEIAISELEVRGITGIYAVPLDLRKKTPRLLDSIHRTDGMSFVDKGFILAFLFATVGATKGFVWTWGPVIWGLIAAAVGFMTGVLWSWILYLCKRHRHETEIRKGKKGEVILVVTCDESQTNLVEDILWDHQALGLAITR